MVRILLVILFVICVTEMFGQITGGAVSGNFQTDFQYYQQDEKLGITDSTLWGRRTGLNSYANLFYNTDHFEAGIRYEHYTPPIIGYDQRFEGNGIASRYIRFYDDAWDITAGNFYEQFGNGLIFRSYQDWALGLDNSMDGIKLKYRPVKGVYLKLLSGLQRYYWDRWDKNDDRGIVSGADLEIDLNQSLVALADKKTRIVAGGSFVTKTQKDNHPFYRVPKNVGSFAGRLNLSRGNFALIGEYAYKINDPSADNGMIYKPGEALFLQASYAMKGFSFSVGCKRLDNMSFRSDRNAQLNDLMINYLPALSKQHVYGLPANYPYATQSNGENGFIVSAGYKIKKGTWLGGKYGTDLSVQFSRITDIRRDSINTHTTIGQAGTAGYVSPWLQEGNKFFEDLSFELHRRITKDLKITLMYAWIFYNIAVIEGHPGEEDVISHSVVSDLTWKLSPRQALRFEAQHLSTKQDEGSWALGLIEYTNKGFFTSVQDVWNYGNALKEKQIHYLMVSAGFVKNATRVAASYGRQVDGIVCIGGVCRYMPAISGFSLTITTCF